jgi:hypothetical protein
MGDRAFKAYRGKDQAQEVVLFSGVVHENGTVEAQLANGPSDIKGSWDSVDDMLEQAREIDADPQLVYEG